MASPSSRETEGGVRAARIFYVVTIEKRAYEMGASQMFTDYHFRGAEMVSCGTRKWEARSSTFKPLHRLLNKHVWIDKRSDDRGHGYAQLLSKHSRESIANSLDVLYLLCDYVFNRHILANSSIDGAIQRWIAAQVLAGLRFHWSFN